jgi:hypothetical protein
MTGEPAHLRKGREIHQRRAKELRRREANKRVRAYLRWLKDGCPPGRTPSIPSTADFRISRGERR